VSAFDAAFIGATADEDTLAPLLEALAVTVHIETQGDETYRVTHNGTIYVLDSQVRWAALFGGQSHQTDVLTRDYLALRRSL
jgi:cytochrome oxidase Cu insertion factor (SCO1/SenC/PrrC family)